MDLTYCTFMLVVMCFGWIHAKNSSVNFPLDDDDNDDDDSYGCECGIANQKLKIVGGQVTRRHEYPWMVSLHDTKEYFINQAAKSQFCGGTLISIRWVLTAAHCAIDYVEKPWRLTIGLGRHDLNHILGIFAIPMVASRIEIHPQYNPRIQENDAALIRLLLPALRSQVTQPVCLPASAQDVDFTGAQLVVSGWGAVSEGGGASSKLRDAKVIGVSNANCEKTYKDMGLEITSRMICAGHPKGGKDSCQGDSGGPLMYKCKSRYYLVGIVSFGIGCGQQEYPGVYTRISSVKGWIDEIVSSKEACSRNCTQKYPNRHLTKDLPHWKP